MTQRLIGVGHGQQIMRVEACDARPAQMIGHPARVNPLAQRLELLQVLKIDGVRAAHRERHAMQHYRIALRHLIQHVQRTAAGIQIVF